MEKKLQNTKDKLVLERRKSAKLEDELKDVMVLMNTYSAFDRNVAESVIERISDKLKEVNRCTNRTK